MEKAVNVAQYIYEEYKKIAQSNIDNMKLQKLLYFAQRESIAVTGVPMFSDMVPCAMRFGLSLRNTECRAAIAAYLTRLSI